MGVLSHKMQEQQPLGFTEKFPVPAALEDVFNKLVKALAPLQHPASQIIFSVDSFDESLAELGVYQNDKFIKKIEKYRGTPNIKICHMRHYSTLDAAHWHALFAETDKSGAFIRIVATDSRTNNLGEGITAQKDITKYASLYGFNVEFIKGAQQPFSVKACWLYALANLASFAATGREYKPRTPHLGKELSELIETRKELTFFNTGTSSNMATPTPVETSYPFSWEKGGGSGLIMLAVLLPLSLPTNLFILATGITLALLGAALLLIDFYNGVKEESSTLSKFLL
ncbi:MULTISPECIES: hypothetical protein [unclassified Legionella]|uniref:hypothetical protein n=1 Tax=unclassified Legionella TaxID=2622702 RepID=UPI001E5F6398|nr:hypothetical protein [Legionella sp. 31fI33]MCC5015163.1 hypothetical protein [Legionella sp. 31fI33]